MDVKILVEATCDLNDELIEKYNIDVIDMDFVVDGKIYTSKNLDNEFLHNKMRNGAKCSTSQVSTNTYFEKYKELLKDNLPIIHLVFSSGLSGEIDRAFEARNMFDEQHSKMINIVDSKCASTGQGIIAILTREYAKKSNNISNILEYINNLKLRLNHLFTVDNLMYLANGGRLKKSSAIIGNIMNVKPILKMNEQGKLEFMHNILSRKKAILELAKTAVSSCSGEYNTMYISQAGCLNDAQVMKEYIENNSEYDVVITSLGPVITCHSGPGTIAVYYITKNMR